MAGLGIRPSPVPGPEPGLHWSECLGKFELIQDCYQISPETNRYWYRILDLCTCLPATVKM